MWQQQLLIGECALEDQELLERRGTFIPAAVIQESRPGYSYKNGEHGLGYYAEALESAERSELSSNQLDQLF